MRGNIETKVENTEHSNFQVGKLLVRETTDLGVVHEVVGDIIKILAGENDGGDEKAMEAETGEGELRVVFGGEVDVVEGSD